MHSNESRKSLKLSEKITHTTASKRLRLMGEDWVPGFFMKHKYKISVSGAFGTSCFLNGPRGSKLHFSIKHQWLSFLRQAS